MSGAPSGGPRRLKIAAIVLAAGRSSRFGRRNKLLEPIDGIAMVRRVALAARASGARPVIAVTGHEAARVADALAGAEVTTVLNQDWEQGLSLSLRVGLRALPSGCDGAIILLGDMPAIGEGELKALISAFVARGGEGVCVPVRHGRRGNPVLWGARFFAEISALCGRCRRQGIAAPARGSSDRGRDGYARDLRRHRRACRSRSSQRHIRSAEIDTNGIGRRRRIRRWEGRCIAHGGERHLV